MWKFHRNMARPFFSRERITDFEIFKRHSDHAVELIKARSRAGEPIDLQVAISCCFAFDIEGFSQKVAC